MTGSIQKWPAPKELTGFASADGFKSVIRDELNALTIGQLLPVYTNIASITLSPFYQTYYSGFLSRLTANRGWGLLSDAFGVLVLVTMKDGTVTFASK